MDATPATPSILRRIRALAILCLSTLVARSALAAGPDFTVALLPDTQFYTLSFPAIFDAQTQWLVANRDALPIVYVAHLGDCVESGNNDGNPVEWLVADAAMRHLEDAVGASYPDGIPYGIAVGNHDQSPIGIASPGSTASYNQFFGEGRFQGRSYYAGHFGSDNDNHVDFFSARGMDFIVIYLEYDSSPDAAVLAWADSLLATHASRRAIVISHFIITGDGVFAHQGELVYEQLKDNPNLFLMASGHRSGEAQRVDVFSGNTVRTLLSNYQNRAEGGSGWLRLLEFSPTHDEIRVKTYSPWLSQFETDEDSQFTIPYDLDAPACTSSAECDDGLFCNGVESCSETGRCEPGAPPSFDDGVACTVDSCDEATDQGLHTPSAALCSDGLFCNGAESCSAATGCQAGTPPTLDDGIACTEDSCDEAGDQVLHQPNASVCDDGEFCNGAEVCSAESGCGAGAPLVIEDGIACTTDSCDEANDQVLHQPDHAACDDGAFCNGVESCSSSQGCELSTPPNLDDGIACTQDSCDEVGHQVLHLPDDEACDDGDPCTAELCDALTGCTQTPIEGCPHKVPAVSPGGLTLLVLAIAALGGWRLRRSERPAQNGE